MSAATFKLSSNGGSSYLTAGVAMSGANALAFDHVNDYSMKAALNSPSSVVSVTWSISKVDDEHDTGDITLTPAADKTVTFTVPGDDPIALVLTASVVTTAGVSVTDSLVIRVKTRNGYELGAVDETTEAGTTGSAPVFNNAFRDASRFRSYPFVESLLAGGAGTTIRTIATLPAKFLLLGCHYRLSTAITGAGTVDIRIGDRAGTNQEFVQSKSMSSATSLNTFGGLATSEIGTDMASGNNYKGYLLTAKALEVYKSVSGGSITAGEITGILYGLDLV